MVKAVLIFHEVRAAIFLGEISRNMMFEPVLQVVALHQRGDNFVRTPACSTEPTERHIRLSEQQFDGLVEETFQQPVNRLLTAC